MLSRLGVVALAAPVVLVPSAMGETLPGGSKPSEMMPSDIQILGSSPSSRNPSLSRNNAANWSRPDAASVTQVPREVAQEDANKQQPTNSQPQREKQPSNNAGREEPNSQPPSQGYDAVTLIQKHNQRVIDGQEALTNKFNKLPPLPGD